MVHGCSSHSPALPSRFWHPPKQRPRFGLCFVCQTKRKSQVNVVYLKYCACGCQVRLLLPLPPTASSHWPCISPKCYCMQNVSPLSFTLTTHSSALPPARNFVWGPPAWVWPFYKKIRLVNFIYIFFVEKKTDKEGEGVGVCVGGREPCGCVLLAARAPNKALLIRHVVPQQQISSV